MRIRRGGLLARFGYGYDLDHATGMFSRLGQRVTMTTEVPEQGLVNAVTQYRYDPAYQLTRADYPAAASFGGETHSWTYDANGNTLTRGGETYGLDSENRMTSISGTTAVVPLLQGRAGMGTGLRR